MTGPPSSRPDRSREREFDELAQRGYVPDDRLGGDCHEHGPSTPIRIDRRSEPLIQHFAIATKASQDRSQRHTALSLEGGGNPSREGLRMRQRLALIQRYALVAFVALALSLVSSAQAEAKAPVRLGELRLVGDATRVDAGVVRLTGAVPSSLGAAWTEQPLEFGRGFDARFRFKISGDDCCLGADGLAFLVQGEGLNALGGDGHALGYATHQRLFGDTFRPVDGITNSLAIEFATYYDNTVSIQSRGPLPNDTDPAFSLAATSVPDLRNVVHDVRVRYREDQLTVHMDGRRLLTVSNLDLADYLQLDTSRAWFGFTAATGGATDNHDILSFRIHTKP